MWPQRAMNLPNSLTVTRIFLVPLLVVVLLTKFEGRQIFGVPKEIVGAAIFALASLTDWADGYLARRRKQITPLGQLIDPLADKLLTSAALISLVQMDLAQIVAGDEDRRTAGAGDFMLIDWGADHGVTPGTRLAIYRDVRTPGLPLASVGDAVVITVGPMLSLTRISRARDAVQSGDYVAIRK